MISERKYETTVSLTCEPNAMAAVLQLLSQGVLVKARVPATIRGLLCRQLGISDDYLDKRVNTLFLNGKAVDDVDTAVVGNRATLALSASMPGFVGAAFRRGGYYASMRDNVSYVEAGEATEAEEGWVTLKLFNMTCPELGPLLLAAGIYVESKVLGSFFAARSAPFWTGCRSIRLNDREMDPEDLQRRQWWQEPGIVKLMGTTASRGDR